MKLLLSQTQLVLVQISADSWGPEPMTVPIWSLRTSRKQHGPDRSAWTKRKCADVLWHMESTDQSLTLLEWESALRDLHPSWMSAWSLDRLSLPQKGFERHVFSVAFLAGPVGLSNWLLWRAWAAICLWPASCASKSPTFPALHTLWHSHVPLQCQFMPSFNKVLAENFGSSKVLRSQKAHKLLQNPESSLSHLVMYNAVYVMDSHCAEHQEPATQNHVSRRLYIYLFMSCSEKASLLAKTVLKHCTT